MSDLADYAGFILASPDLLDKLTALYFEKISESKIPILSQLTHLDQHDLKKNIDNNLITLLNWMADGSSYADAAADTWKDWQMTKINGVAWEKIMLKDIIGIYDLRRSVLLHFLPTYTSDIKQFVRVAQELGTLFNQLREKVIQSIIDLQQQQLQQQKEFSASLINNSINGVLSFDNELVITEFNRVLEQWMGLRKADVVGRLVFDVFPRYRRRKEAQLLGEVLKGRRIFIPERPLFAQKGRYFEANITPFFNQDHQITGGLAVVYETTHRKEAERLIQQKNTELAQALAALQATTAALQTANTALEARVSDNTRELVERENFLNSIIEQSPVSTWIADASGNVIQANKASQELFGTDQPGKGHPLHNILEDKVIIETPYMPQIEAVYKEGKVARFSLEYNIGHIAANKRAFRRRRVSLIWTIFPIKDKTGKVSNAVVQHEDITEIRKAEQALKYSNERLRLIADALPVLISYIDQDRKFRFANQEYERWYHKSQEEIVNKYLWEVMGDIPYKSISNLLARALAGEHVNAEVMQNYGSNIGKKHISATLIPHIVNKKVAGIFALVTDISARKQNEQMLETLYEEARLRNDELKRINVDLDNFVFSASHDLKSPIANLEGLLSLITREVSPKIPERDRKLVDLMGTSLNKLKKTIEDLIGITRLQKQGDEHFNEETSFQEIVNDVKDDLKQLLEESNARLIEQYHAPTLLYARSHLRSIFYNLLSNALKYRSPNRQLAIEIETSYSNHDILLRIKDNGLGMSPEQQDKLFSMFTRMHEHVEGTGIGLYSIKRIIENKGGTISVHSELGKGTEFLIYFNQL